MAGLDSNTKLYLPFDENTLGATTVDGALEVLDYGSGGNVITKYGGAVYQTADTIVWNATLDFQGSDDRLIVDTPSNLQITGDLTLACWFKGDTFSSSTSANPLIVAYSSGETEAENILYYLSVDDGLVRIIWEYGNGSNEALVSTTSTTMDTGEWYHIMMVRDTTAKTVDFYVNGSKLGNTVSYSNNPTGGTSTSLWIGGSAFDFDGRIGDIRIWNNKKDSTDATKLYGSGSGTTSSIDDDELFWVQGCQDQSGDGGSGNYHIPTFEGSAQLDTALTQARDFGSSNSVISFIDGGTYQTTTTKLWNASFEFDGINDGVSTGNQLLSSTAISISAFIRITALSGDEHTIFSQWVGTGSFQKFIFRVEQDGDLRCYAYNNDSSYGYVETTDTPISEDTWYHVAMVWDGQAGTNVKFYVNGSEDTNKSASGTLDAITGSTPSLGNIGVREDGGDPFEGQLSDFRLFKDELTSGEISDLYNSGSGTKDGIGDEFIWLKGTTVYGDGSSSLYLDGNSDYVSLPDSADWDIAGSSSQDYTIDLWVRHTNYDGFETYLHQGDNSFADCWRFYHRNSDAGNDGITFDVRTGNSTVVKVGGDDTTEITDTNWHHVALCKVTSAGPTVEWGLYLDGTQTAYVSNATTDTYAGPLWVGCTDSSGPANYFDGNMAHWRITPTNVFSASPNATPDDTITVPTGPYTYDAPPPATGGLRSYALIF